MDDERFYELIRRTFAEVRDLNRKQHPSHYPHTVLMERVEREINARELAAAVSRENARIALVGPGAKSFVMKNFVELKEAAEST